MNELRPAVFLDRDGTINVEKEYLYKIEDFEYMDGAIEGLRQLQNWEYMLVIVTNQSGIARGYYGEDEFRKLTNWMLCDMEKHEIHIDGVYICPHHPEGKIEKYRKICNCRKPKTGLFYQAARECGIDFSKSIAIGDKMRDLEICRETGAHGFLLSEKCGSDKEITFCRDWTELIYHIGKMRMYVDIR